MDISSLFAAAANHPIVKLLSGLMVLATVIYWAQKGINLRLDKWPKTKKRKWAKMLSANALGPATFLILFGSKTIELPRRGFWGYSSAALLGWLCSLAAVAWHINKKKRAKKAGKIPK